KRSIKTSATSSKESNGNPQLKKIAPNATGIWGSKGIIQHYLGHSSSNYHLSTIPAFFSSAFLSSLNTHHFAMVGSLSGLFLSSSVSSHGFGFRMYCIFFTSSSFHIGACAYLSVFNAL